MVLAALLAPWLFTVDPIRFNPVNRLKTPSETVWFGTDMYGRDVYSRAVYGTRISLVVGIAVALLSVAIGLAIGLVSGYMRTLDHIIMRVMDGLMAIPAILLAVAPVSLSGATIVPVVIAITIPEVPPVVRLVGRRVLSVRQKPK